MILVELLKRDCKDFRLCLNLVDEQSVIRILWILLKLNAGKMKISTVVITFNEERNIERCLRSVMEVSDEIIVVDSYSTDRTIEIAEEFGARIFKREFEGHIQQKSWAISQASEKYVLSLDADEALDELLVDYIRKLKEEDTPAEGYIFNRLTNFCGKWIRHCGWYPDRKLRLFRKEHVTVAGLNPHDKFILPSQAKLKIVPKGDILHYSFYSISEHIHQIQKFSTIAAESALKKGRNASVLFDIIGDPIYTFFKKYFLQLGILDGYYGFVISINTSYSKFLKYIKLKELHAKKTKEESK